MSTAVSRITAGYVSSAGGTSNYRVRTARETAETALFNKQTKNANDVGQAAITMAAKSVISKFSAEKDDIDMEAILMAIEDLHSAIANCKAYHTPGETENDPSTPPTKQQIATIANQAIIDVSGGTTFEALAREKCPSVYDTASDAVLNPFVGDEITVETLIRKMNGKDETKANMTQKERNAKTEGAIAGGAKTGAAVAAGVATVGVVAAMAGGAKLGAAVGTVGGPIGIAVGVAAGAVIGGIAGWVCSLW